MAAKSSKKVEKVKSKSVRKTPKMEVISESGVTIKEESFLSGGAGIGDGCDADGIDREAAAFVAGDPETAGPASAIEKAEPQALTLPLLADSGTLFIQGAQQLTAQLLGQPESAVMLVKVNGWLDDLGKVKKLIVGDDDKVEGLKAKVISDGQPWGEKGSKQLTLAGAVVKVKAVNWRDADAALTINDLDPAKVEAYLRGNVDPTKENVEKVLGSYMKGTMTWGLKDLSPTQQKNLTTMLADPGEWGQGLRQCLKETKYQMLAPTMEGES